MFLIRFVLYLLPPFIYIATSSVAVSSSSNSKTGGVAIYRNSFTDCNRVNIDISEIHLEVKDTKAGDIRRGNVEASSNSYPGTAFAEIIYEISSRLIPVTAVGDFNVAV